MQSKCGLLAIVLLLSGCERALGILGLGGSDNGGLLGTRPLLGRSNYGDLLNAQPLLDGTNNDGLLGNKDGILAVQLALVGSDDKGLLGNQPLLADRPLLGGALVGKDDATVYADVLGICVGVDGSKPDCDRTKKSIVPEKKLENSHEIIINTFLENLSQNLEPFNTDGHNALFSDVTVVPDENVLNSVKKFIINDIGDTKYEYEFKINDTNSTINNSYIFYSKNNMLNHHLSSPQENSSETRDNMTNEMPGAILKGAVSQIQTAILKQVTNHIPGAILKKAVSQIQTTILKEAANQVQTSILNTVANQIPGTILKEAVSQIQTAIINDAVIRIQTAILTKLAKQIPESILNEAISQIQTAILKEVVNQIQIATQKKDFSQAPTEILEIVGT